MPKIEFKKAEATISRSLLYLFTSVQLLFGFNFGFFNQMKGRIKTVAQYSSVATGLFMITYLAYVSICELSWLVYALQYLFSTIILMTNNYSLYDFLLDVKSIYPSETERSDNIGVITWLYSLFMFMVKMIIGSLYNAYTDDSRLLFKSHFLVLIPMLALDIIPVANFLVFYYMYSKLRAVNEGYKKGKIELIEVQNTYKEVGDLFDKIRPVNDKLIVLAFVTDAPKWMLTIWNHLILQRTTQSWLVHLCSFSYGVHLTLQICLPAVCAELVHVQTDAITLVLQEQLVFETDVQSSHKLTCLLRYLRGRPLLRKAWRLVPLDLGLPVTMLSMCMTYLVVIIQFSHLYD